MTPPLRTTLLAAALALVLGACADRAPGDYPPGPYGVERGDTAPNLALQRCDGTPFHLADLYGSATAVWLALHSVSCRICASQHVFLDDFQTRHAAEGVQVLVVLGDAAADGDTEPGAITCTAFERDADLAVPVLRDDDFAAAGDLARRGVPTQVLLDARMTIRTVEPGWDPSFQEARFEQLVAEIVGP